MPVIRISGTIAETFLSLDTPQARVGQAVTEVWMTRPTPSPTTVTGAGVSQAVTEVWMALDTPEVRVSQSVVEVFMSAAGAIGIGGTGEGGQKAYGGAT
jgi:hypothetical protein